MDNTQAIMAYEAILATTGKMLAAAQNNEWDELVSLEKECRQLTEILIKKNPEPILDRELLQKKVKIIHQIQDENAQARALTKPWVARLPDILSINGRTRTLQHASQSIDNV